MPNLTAYNETCAAQANIYWNQRMFLLTGHGKYIDVLERTLYNGFLSGVGMDGKSFFYVNPLECDGQFRFNRDDNMSRQPWFQTSCCPTNVVRLLPSLSGYIFAQRENDLYVNLYVTGDAKLRLGDKDARLTQSTNYPWDGKVQLQIELAEPTTFTLKLRVPGFALDQPLPSDLYRYLDASAEPVSLMVDGQNMPVEIENGFINITRRWDIATSVELQLLLPVRRVMANPQVENLRGMVALERGPLVYALEAVDNESNVRDLMLADSSQLSVEHQPGLLGGITIISGQAVTADGNAVQFTAIPYYAWGHRDAGEMTVWLRRR